MNLLGQMTLGIVILLLLGIVVIVKRAATGAVLDRPQGGLLVQLVNVFNLFFLLVVNPSAAILLMTRRLEALDPTHVNIGEPSVLVVVEIAGLLLYVAGFALMAWALVALGRYYQLGGSTPRSEDRLITDGPYGLIRHPMYAAALSISAGLALLSQSWAFLCVFFIYLALILPLISLEEERLQKAYGEQYTDYQRKTRKLLFFLPRSSGNK